jgi:hypothetical protein
VANAKREHVAVLLAAGQSVAKASRTVGVSQRSVFTWLEDPSYSARLDELRGAMLSRTMSFLTANTLRAARKLRRLLDDADSRVVLQAAKAVLENASRLRQEISIEQRVAELERLAAERKDKQP